MNLAHRSTRSARPIILSTSFTLLAMAAAATLTACGGGDDAVATARRKGGQVSIPVVLGTN